LACSFGGEARFQPVGEAALPFARGAEHEPKMARTAVEEMTIGLPGEADAAVRLDVLLRREPIGGAAATRAAAAAATGSSVASVESAQAP
jgi:hypothetical protein